MTKRETLLLDLLDSDDPSLREIYLSNFSVDKPSEGLIDRIVQLARTDAARRVREAAVKILVRFWPDKRVVALYRDLVDQSDVETITSVVKAMNGLDDQLSYEIVCDLYHNKKDFQVKAAVLVALSRRPFPQVKSFLVDELIHDRDEFIRAMTVTALSRKGDASVLPILLERTRDHDARVRANAFEGLIRHLDRVPEEVFLDALEDPHHRVQIAALKALHRLGWGGVTRKLDEMRSSPAERVQASVHHFMREVEGILDRSRRAQGASERVVH